MDNCLVPFPAELTALTVKLDVPTVVGVPEITPLSARLKPVGNASLSTLHVMGAVPVAVSVCLYAVPTVPSGNVAVVIVGATAVAIVMDNCLVSLPAALVAFTVKVDVPAVVGVPVIAPVAARLRSAGKVPLSMFHVMGAVPVAVSVWLYSVPTTPFGNDVVVIATAAIVMENSLVSFPAALVAFKVKVDVPAAVGVPVIAPSAARLKPAGNAPPARLHVTGVSPVASSVRLYAVPTVPPGNDVVVIFGAVTSPSVPPPPVPPSSPQAAKENPITVITTINPNRCANRAVLLFFI
jgi:hypothetical protein